MAGDVKITRDNLIDLLNGDLARDVSELART